MEKSKVALSGLVGRVAGHGAGRGSKEGGGIGGCGAGDSVGTGSPGARRKHATALGLQSAEGVDDPLRPDRPTAFTAPAGRLETYWESKSRNSPLAWKAAAQVFLPIP